VSKQRPVQESLLKDATRVQAIVAKQQKAFQETAQRVQETAVKLRKFFLQDAKRAQETVAKSHSVSSSLLAWQVCAQEKLAAYVSSNLPLLARQRAVVDSPRSVAPRILSVANLYPVVRQWIAGGRRAFSFLPVRIAVVLH